MAAPSPRRTSRSKRRTWMPTTSARGQYRTVFFVVTRRPSAYECYKRRHTQAAAHPDTGLRKHNNGMRPNLALLGARERRERQHVRQHALGDELARALRDVGRLGERLPARARERVDDRELLDGRHRGRELALLALEVGAEDEDRLQVAVMTDNRRAGDETASGGSGGRRRRVTGRCSKGEIASRDE